MLFAHQFLVLDSPYVSQELSPPVNWLSSFQAFVGDSYPEKSTEDGAVRQSAFYELLREFLEASVRAPHATRETASLCVCALGCFLRSQVYDE